MWEGKKYKYRIAEGFKEEICSIQSKLADQYKLILNFFYYRVFQSYTKIRRRAKYTMNSYVPLPSFRNYKLMDNLVSSIKSSRIILCTSHTSNYFTHKYFRSKINSTFLISNTQYMFKFTIVLCPKIF